MESIFTREIKLTPEGCKRFLEIMNEPIDPKRIIKITENPNKVPVEEYFKIMKAYHIIPKPKGRWGLQRHNATRATKLFDDKDEAVSYFKSKHKTGRLYIHRDTGSISDTINLPQQ